MRPIPLKMRNELAQEKRMTRCAVQGMQFGPCEGRIQWHHVWKYAGKQINAKWAIVGACERHHFLVDGWRLLKEAFMRASLRLATEEDLAMYPKNNWEQIKKSLALS